MMRRTLAVQLALAALLPLAGCRIHLARIDLNDPLSENRYDAIVLGESTRRDVLALLGAPDSARYTPDTLIFDYWAASHRGTDLYFFVPSDVVPAPIDPLSFLAIPRFFFDLFGEPEQFRPTFMEGAGRTTADAVTSLVPFTSGEELLTLRGRRSRLDRLRVVFDRETLEATSKALRLATGDYKHATLAKQILLRDE